MIEVLSNEKHKARKEHVCYFCGDTIKKGTVYNRQDGKFDGDWYTVKTHISCSELAVKLDMYDNGEDGLTNHEFRDIVNEKFEELLPEFEMKTTFRSRLDVVKMQVLFGEES